MLIRKLYNVFKNKIKYKFIQKKKNTKNKRSTCIKLRNKNHYKRDRKLYNKSTVIKNVNSH